MKNIIRIFSYVSPKKRVMLLSIFLMFIAVIISSAAPIVQSMITKHITNGSGINMKYISSIAIGLLAMYLITTALRATYLLILTTTIEKGMFKLRSDVQSKVHQVPVKYYDTHLLGEVSSRITSDITTISNGFQEGLPAIISSTFLLVFVIAMMMIVNVWLGLIVLFIMPVIGTVAYIIVKKTTKIYQHQQRALGKFQGMVQEKYTGFKEITLYGKHEDAILELSAASDELANLGFRSQFISGLLKTFVSLIIYSLIAVIALIGIKLLSLKVHELQPLILYVWFLNSPLSQITQLFSIIQVTTAACQRVFEFLDEDNELVDIDNPTELGIVNGHVIFDNVVFGYDPLNPILKGVSFEAKPGQVIAVVGPTGAGKTTLINLLMRFYDINSGSITLDGTSIYDLRRDDLRSSFGMVLQDTWLFKGTIRDNIRYGRANASDTDVINAAKLANVHHTIETLPGGYDMVINEEADNISLGEKQLLTIARAILSNPSILILDEATSTVDTRLEHNLQAAMNELMKGRTSFVIAHRLSTIQNADMILVIKDGEIVERGNHKNLLSENGFYNDLYNSQFGI